MDGDRHATSIDLDTMFKDRLILHSVARDEVKEPWLETKSIDPEAPDILVEVNDRTVSVYMRAFVATEVEQIHGNPRSHFRDDLILAWTHGY